MSWIGMLYKTYLNCAEEVGISHEDPGNVLLPVAHTLRQAQIEIRIDADGNYLHGASHVLTDKKDQTTIIPCTEQSDNRTSSVSPHPLFDNLKYIAGDYKEYCKEDNSSLYSAYIERLSSWCNSPFANPKAVAIEKYLRKGCLIADLVSDGILFCADGKLLEKWNGVQEERPPIFGAATSPDAAFVRICVQDGADERTWLDTALQKSHIDYTLSIQNDEGLCFVTGDVLQTTKNHPKFLRYPGDGAKLISGNDTSGFTFRGRFNTAEEAMCISYEASQKAHSALKWLIARQGIRVDSQVFVTWGTSNPPVPDFTADTFDFAAVSDPPDEQIDTREGFSARLRSTINGYRKNISDMDDIIVMGVDSATTGRLSILYYQEFKAKDFFERITFWHDTCVWKHTYKSDYSDPKKPLHFTFVGAPAPKDIILAAYGKGASDKLIKAAHERLVPCILNRAAFPVDIMLALARRAGSPVSMENWEYQKTLSIACAAITKVYNDRSNKIKHPDRMQYEEEWGMNLDETCKDRSYLFGRWLAYAQHAERTALKLADADGRDTNAERMMHQFTITPSKTCEILNRQLTPYFARLKASGLSSVSERWKIEMLDLLDKIGHDRFINEQLDTIYLIGYASQLIKFEENKAAAIAAKKLKEEA